MHADVKKTYTSKLDANFKGIVEVVTKTIESVDKNLVCDIKWGRLTYGLAGDYHHWLCGVALTKKTVNLIFHFGGILDDKNKHFIAGDSFFLRKLEYSSVNDIDKKEIKDFVRQAINKLDYFKNNWKELNKNSKR